MNVEYFQHEILSADVRLRSRLSDPSLWPGVKEFARKYNCVSYLILTRVLCFLAGVCKPSAHLIQSVSFRTNLRKYEWRRSERLNFAERFFFRVTSLMNRSQKDQTGAKWFSNLIFFVVFQNILEMHLLEKQHFIFWENEVSLCLKQGLIICQRVGKINFIQRENGIYFSDSDGRYLFLF